MKLALVTATIFTLTLGLYTLEVSAAPVKTLTNKPVTTVKTPA
jgi:hypothetical protein